MTKVYVLTDGSYSDYHIIGVFSTEKAGIKAQKEFGGDFEEYELDELGKDNRVPFYVRFDDTGTNCNPESSYNINMLNTIRCYTHPGHPHPIYATYVMAEDKEHAIKIAADLVAQYKAMEV